MSWDFDTIPKYVINLDRRRDRWQQFQAQPGLKSFSNIRRFSGVDGGKINIDDDKRVSLFTKSKIVKGERRSHSELNTKGGVGCYLSHVGVWQEFLNSSSEVALVFEDDVKLDEKAADRVKSWIRNSPVIQNADMWDFCILSPSNRAIRGEPIVQDDITVVELKQFTCMVCYLITKKGVRKVMPSVFPIEGHVDWFLSIAGQLGIIKLCCPMVRLVTYNNSPTDIHLSSGCDICNVKTDFSKTSTIVPKWRVSAYKFEEALLAIGLFSAMYLLTKKN